MYLYIGFQWGWVIPRNFSIDFFGVHENFMEWTTPRVFPQFNGVLFSFFLHCWVTPRLIVNGNVINWLIHSYWIFFKIKILGDLEMTAHENTFINYEGIRSTQSGCPRPVTAGLTILKIKGIYFFPSSFHSSEK